VLVASDAELRNWSRRLRPEEDAAVDAFFVEYLQSSDCRADALRLEPGSVGSADDASSLKMVVDGSYTEAGAKQTLVVFFAGHCGVLGAHAEGYGTTFNLLLQDTQIIASSTAGPRGVELQPIDLDHDGFTELVNVGADYASGTTFTSADVWSYRSGKPEMLAKLDLALNSCNVPEGEHYESKLLARWDQARNTLCFLAKRNDIGCPTTP
jgi:hypothetical protein